MTLYKKTLRGIAVLGALLAATAAHADLKVGIDLSSTGPAAVIGITSKNAMLMWPDTIAGQKADYIILDDGSDPGAAVRNIHKLINEDHVDVIVGPNITPAAIAALDPVAESQTPMITLIGPASVVEPQEGKKVWAYKMAQTDSAMAEPNWDRPPIGSRLDRRRYRLRGWAYRIRTSMCREKIHLFEHAAIFGFA